MVTQELPIDINPNCVVPNPFKHKSIFKNYSVFGEKNQLNLPTVEPSIHSIGAWIDYTMAPLVSLLKKSINSKFNTGYSNGNE